MKPTWVAFASASCTESTESIQWKSKKHYCFVFPPYPGFPSICNLVHRDTRGTSMQHPHETRSYHERRRYGIQSNFEAYFEDPSVNILETPFLLEILQILQFATYYFCCRLAIARLHYSGICNSLSYALISKRRAQWPLENLINSIPGTDCNLKMLCLFFLFEGVYVNMLQSKIGL